MTVKLRCGSFGGDKDGVDRAQMEAHTEAMYACEATAIGEYLAVHRHHAGGGEFNRRWWDLTHIPTGMMLDRKLRRAQVDELARRLEGLDWNFDAPAGCPVETRLKAGAIIETHRLRKAVAA